MGTVPLRSTPPPTLSEADFGNFRRFIYETAGIDMSPAKRALIQSRLSKRLRELNLPSFTAYWRYINADAHAEERQRTINLLSTNETYFFREADHFRWLAQRVRHLAATSATPLRIWSAACSTGEEPYSIAMTVADAIGLDTPWVVHATDINTGVLQQARRAIYPIARVEKTPLHLWTRYLLRGEQEFRGQVRVRREIVERVQFGHLNLLETSRWGQNHFDVVFLRNALIYFDEPTKYRILGPICRKLRDGGHLLVGHSEVIRHFKLPLRQEAPSRYCLQAAPSIQLPESRHDVARFNHR